jgi:SET domain-containing protein|tara:strand:- start:79 stop:471 length:393 start_codon:yes stop_codon:yes gene_type:complete
MGEMVREEAKTVRFDENSYMPLPSSLRIGDSDVHGQGLFAKEDIPQGTDLGLSHVFVMHDWDGEVWGTKYWQRTPLGGFINHSETPNVLADIEGPRTNFFTKETIKSGEELFITYEHEKVAEAGGSGISS